MQDQPANPLQALTFLEGTWHGEGIGAYGPFDFETKVEARGRWMLLTTSMFRPDTDDIFYVSTQVYGYDGDELLLHLFDTDGVFEFRGTAIDDALHLQWQGDHASKRSELQLQDDGTIYARYESYSPLNEEAPQVFEYVWERGARVSKDADVPSMGTWST